MHWLVIRKVFECYSKQSKVREKEKFACEIRLIKDFELLLDIPTSEDRKREAYRQKIAECIDRAEKLKDLIDREKGIVKIFSNVLESPP